MKPFKSKLLRLYKWNLSSSFDSLERKLDMRCLPKNLLHTFAKVWVVLQIWFSEGDFNFTAEMVQKAAEAKLLRKAQRQAAMDAAKMAKRERG